MTQYPAQLDDVISLPPAIDNITGVNAATVNNLRGTIIAIESELGVKPSGIYGTVKQRLDIIEATIAGIEAGGSIVVVGTPTVGQTISWTGTRWVPTNFPISFSAGGDLSGTNTSQTVIGIQNRPVSSTVPTPGQTYIWNGTQWTPGSAGGSSVQTGANYGKYLLVNPWVVNPFTSSPTFINAGTFEFDPTTITAANGTRTIKLRTIVHTTGPQMTVRLFNLTANGVVSGTNYTTTSTSPTLTVSGDLTSATNFTNGYAVYQIQILMAASALNSDQIVMDMATLRIDWS